MIGFLHTSGRNWVTETRATYFFSFVVVALMITTLFSGFTVKGVEAAQRDHVENEVTPAPEERESPEINDVAERDESSTRPEEVPTTVVVTETVQEERENTSSESETAPANTEVEKNLGDQPLDTPVEPTSDDEVDISVTPILIDDLPELAETATIHLTKSGCPDDFEGDVDQMAYYCVPMEAPFTVYSTNSNDSFTGGFTLDVLPGPTVIKEVVPSGWIDPVAYCSLTHADGTNSGSTNVLSNGGSTVTIDLKAGDYLDCQWYNLPPKGKAHLSINKHECPAGFFPYAATWEAISQHCGSQVDGVSFTATFPNGFAFSQQTGAYTTGVVYWMEILTGTYSVEEAIPSGYGEPIVFCIRRDVETGITQEVFQATVFVGNRIIVNIFEDSDLACDWYNVPFTGDGVIIIDKHDCPEGTVGNADEAELAATCTEEMNGITFKLSGPANVSFEQATGDIYNSRIFADHLPGGDYTITEKLPVGYGKPAVFCGTMKDFEAEPQPIGIDTSGNQIVVDLPKDGIVFCDWYNIPG